MRIFAISDLHVDYEYNVKWLTNLSKHDFTEDILIVAGDISDSLKLLEQSLRTVTQRFKTVLFVPGNHDLWQLRDTGIDCSLNKFAQVLSAVNAAGASMNVFNANNLCILPLLSWYDYSFGQPSKELMDSWMDYRACRWPNTYKMEDVATYFEKLNSSPQLNKEILVITFSHFLPRIDVLPTFSRKFLNPVLGATRIDQQLRKVNSKIHIYGHSHINRQTLIDGVTYVNNALGYPHENLITSRQLLCVHSV